MTNLIGICGIAGSGKTTVAGIITHLIFNHYYNTNEEFKEWGAFYSSTGWEIHSFGDKLKQVAAILLGVAPSIFSDRNFKESTLPSKWDKVTTLTQSTFVGKRLTDIIRVQMSVRQFLQELGTDAVRNNLHIDTWVNALFNDYVPNSKWVIPDVRFWNEYNAIRDKGGIIISINRDTPVVSRHISESEWVNFDKDYIIDNNGTVKDLIPKVEKILQKEGIIK